MKILGVDYGTKRIGLAMSDESHGLAFPKEIIMNDANVFDRLAKVLKEKAISEIVVGDSLDFSGKPNKLAADIEVFIRELKNKFNLPVHKQKEFLTSVEARRYHEGQVDASAAALILQRYLDLSAQTAKKASDAKDPE